MIDNPFKTDRYRVVGVALVAVAMVVAEMNIKYKKVVYNRSFKKQEEIKVLVAQCAMVNKTSVDHHSL